MKTLKLTIAIFLISIFTFSCSKDENATNPADGIFRIQQIEFSNDDVHKYTYNAQNIIETIITNTTYTKFTYNDAGKLKTIETRGSSIIGGIENYTYDASGFKTEQLYTCSTGYKSKTTFTNNSIGLPISVTSYIWNSATNLWVIQTINILTNTYNSRNQKIKEAYTDSYSEYIYDAAGNLVEKKDYFKSSNNPYYLSRLYNFSYDNKKVIIDTPYVTNLHNLTDFKEQQFLPNGNTGGSSVYVLSYEYNEAGYVTKAFYDGRQYAKYILEQTN